RRAGPRRGGGGSLRAAGDRGLDRAGDRAARARRTGCVSRGRSGAAPGLPTRAARPARARRALAPRARLCRPRRPAFVEEHNMLRVDTVETPIGPVHLALEGDALRALRFDTPFEGSPERTPVSDRVRAYFAGDLHALDEVAVEPAGTPFPRRGRAALR